MSTITYTTTGTGGVFPSDGGIVWLGPASSHHAIITPAGVGNVPVELQLKPMTPGEWGAACVAMGAPTNAEQYEKLYAWIVHNRKHKTVGEKVMTPPAIAVAAATKNQSPSEWQLVFDVLTNPLVRTIYIWGPPGVGKTYSAYLHQTEQNQGKEVYAVTMTQDTPAAELRGHYVPKGGELVWQDGPLIAAMKQGARVVVNEISHAPPEVLALLYPIVESAETSRITLPTNDTVFPKEGFQLICTDNLPPLGLPEALQDRFDCELHVDQPCDAAWAALEDDLREVAKATALLEPERRVGLRKWSAVQRLRASLGFKRALQAVLGVDRGNALGEVLALTGAAEKKKGKKQ